MGALVCSHRPPCPGCPRFGDARPPRKAVERLRRVCDAEQAPPPLVVAGAGVGYRHRVRLSVRGRARAPKIGIFREGSHDLVDIPRCVVHHPLINEVVQAVKRAVKVTHTPPYSELAHAGLLRAIQVVIERPTQTAQVVLVANGQRPDELEPLLARLEDDLKGKLHSLWFNGNPERTNRLLGALWHKHCGRDAVEDTMGGVRVFFPPDAFGQANPELAAALVDHVHQWVPGGARVLELYAGVGAIGLGLLAKGCAVQFNELGQGSLRGLTLALAALEQGGPSQAGRANILEGPAEHAVKRCSPADVVIVDPPRKGLGPEVVDALCRNPAERLVYVSCGLDSFEREVGELTRVFRLEKIVAFGLFPFTEHVETLALFRARGSVG